MSVVTDLILGTKTDYHAIAVAWALRELSRRPMIWDGLSIEDGQMIFNLESEQTGFSLNGHEINGLQSLWFRRQVPYKKFSNVTPVAHKFLKRELIEADRILSTLLEGVSQFTVCGSLSKPAQSKALQLQVARDVGFRIPRTLISNSYDAVRSFASGSDVIVKHFAPHYFMKRDHSDLRVVGTSMLGDIGHIDPRSIEVAPAIYQDRIDKSFEVRLTVVGNKLFPTKIYAAHGDAFLDWRPELGKEHCRAEACTLSRETEESALRLMRRLNLEYGCIDLAVSKDGDVYFLEVNPGGQFLFIEDLVPDYPILYAFSSLLMQGRRDYSLDIGWQSKLTMREFERSAEFYDWEEKYARKSEDNFITYTG